MLYLKSWLEEYIDLKDISNLELSHIISTKSGEVEEYKEITDWYNGKILIGKIENVRVHPNADKLKIFDVNLGHSGSIQIVSAAPNVVEGMLVPTAIIGAKLPYLTISERQMRGEKSQGMCCGKSELMLETQYSSGLWDLTTEIPQSFHSQILGMSICEVLPEYFPTQTVFDIKYLPDKIGFLGCHLALALELNLILDGRASLKNKAKRLLNPDIFWQEFQQKALKISNNKQPQANFKDTTGYTNLFSLFELNLEKSFNLDLILQQRLFFTDKNLTDGIADLSNYLLYDVGQPSHFFVESDNKFSWDWEVVQDGDQNDVFEGLGKLEKTTLNKEIRVIKDHDQLVWIPGISGSKATKIEADSTKIYIELANFKTDQIARNSFKLGYKSESCRFWNSGVNIATYLVWLLHLLENLENNNLNFNLNNFLSWLNPNHNLARFEQSDDKFLSFCHRILEIKNLNQVKFDRLYLARRMQADFQANLLDTYLDKLGDVQDNTLTPNIFYSNIGNPQDILFEIARLFGLDKLKHEYLPNFSITADNNNYHSLLSLKKLITDFGFDQVITRPLVNESKLLDQNIALTALSTQRQDENKLRDSLLPSLLEITATNQLRGEKGVKIFEVDKVYSYQNTKLVEKLTIGVILEDQNPYNLTTLIHQISNFSKTENLSHNPISKNYGQGFLYTLDSGLKLELLQINNQIKKDFNINLSKQIWYLEIDLESWNKVNWNYKNYLDESDFPLVNRSFSLVISSTDTLDTVKNIILNTNFKDVNISVLPVERFNLENNLDVLNLNLTFVSNLKTIDSGEINLWQTTLENSLTKELKHFAWR